MTNQQSCCHLFHLLLERSSTHHLHHLSHLPLPQAQSEEEAMCRSSGVGDLIDGLTATQLARRSLQQRLAELGEVRREMGLGGRKRPAGCRLVSREKRQEVQEGVERLVAELEL